MSEPSFPIIELMRQIKRGDEITREGSALLGRLGYMENGRLTTDGATLLAELEQLLVGMAGAAERASAYAGDLPYSVRMELMAKIQRAKDGGGADFSMFSAAEGRAILGLAAAAIITTDPILQPEGAQ